MRAEFDENDHCVVHGYAAYQTRRMRRWRFRCWLDRHIIPTHSPYPPDGHSPGNYWQCPRCFGHLHYFVVGQHRFGGMNAKPKGTTP